MAISDAVGSNDAISDMVVDLSSTWNVSWRDKVLGKGVEGSREALELVESEEINKIEFLKEDVLKSTDRIQQILMKDLVKTLVLMDIENKYYLVKFQYVEDFDKYLIVQPWMLDFNPLQSFSSAVLTWIRLPSLSGHLYKRKILGEFGGLIGRRMKLDYNIASKISGRKFTLR
ncbi:hypothetical protein ES332_A11G131000v1 [Gossypium tomentosum]|uniref:Uncharacterized protein n=1 Tax=Gossypium tomentosum TaxID=34277 RepID=A0A5D2NA39_GOSTO|nr:hypothetical protein ES332_A11G131000v1 [Gossypium tomentosum]